MSDVCRWLIAERDDIIAGLDEVIGWQRDVTTWLYAEWQWRCLMSHSRNGAPYDDGPAVVQWEDRQ